MITPLFLGSHYELVVEPPFGANITGLLVEVKGIRHEAGADSGAAFLAGSATGASETADLVVAMRFDAATFAAGTYRLEVKLDPGGPFEKVLHPGHDSGPFLIDLKPSL